MEIKNYNVHKIFMLIQSHIKEIYEYCWQEEYELLKEHKKIFDDLDIKEFYETDVLTLKFLGLREWLDTQKVIAKKYRLEHDKYYILSDLGLNLGAKNFNSWLAKYKQLSEYFRTNGVNYVKKNVKYRQFQPLVSWCEAQRMHQRKLSSFQKEKLDEIGFIWNLKEEKFIRKDADLLKKIEILRQYKEKYGICKIPNKINPATDTPKFAKLIKLAKYIRFKYRSGDLNEKHIELLKSIGFEFHFFEHSWDRNFAKLIEFKKKYGHTIVPQNWKEDPDLARWVGSQRGRAKDISPERKKKLDEIGFAWNAHEDNFNEKYKKLKEFFHKNGHINVTQEDDKKLFNWMRYLKSTKLSKTKSKLTSEQITKLNELGFFWVSNKNNIFWEEMFNKLLKLKSKFGHLNISSQQHDKQLGRWMTRQRHIKNKLPPEKIKRLDKIGFIWEKSHSKHI